MKSVIYLDFGGVPGLPLWLPLFKFKIVANVFRGQAFWLKCDHCFKQYINNLTIKVLKITPYELYDTQSVLLLFVTQMRINTGVPD